MLAISRDALAYFGTTPLTGNHAAIAALKASDLVLDLMTLLFSPEQHEILASGTKILLAVEPPEVLARMVPTLDDKKRVTAAAEKLGKAKEMHVTSDAGTDVRFALGQFPTISEYGFVDEPGRWDHWPSGFALTWANEGEAEGTIVLERGDILLPMKSYVRDRVHFKIEKGFCTSIEGGFDADILSEYMATFNDPDAYAMSHIGWGLQPRAHWSTQTGCSNTMHATFHWLRQRSLHARRNPKNPSGGIPWTHSSARPAGHNMLHRTNLRRSAPSVRRSGNSSCRPDRLGPHWSGCARPIWRRSAMTAPLSVSGCRRILASRNARCWCGPPLAMCCGTVSA
jgi:hypothetical protein